MITEYYRPKNLYEAAALLEQFSDTGFLVGGGSHVSTHQPENGIAIDLQAACGNQTEGDHYRCGFGS